MVLFPFVKDQEDVIEMVRADYKVQTGKDLPDLFIEFMLEARYITFNRAMEKGDTVRLDRLGKFSITDKKRNYNKVLNEFKGKTLTNEGFRIELNKKYNNGELIVKGVNDKKSKYKFNIAKDKKDD